MKLVVLSTLAAALVAVASAAGTGPPKCESDCVRGFAPPVAAHRSASPGARSAAFGSASTTPWRASTGKET